MSQLIFTEEESIYGICKCEFKLFKISSFFKKVCILLHYTPVLDSVTAMKSQIILKATSFLTLFFSYSR